MRIFRKLVDNGHEERWSVSGVERRDIYQSRFPRKFISRTFSTYAFSNAVKVGLARARACATSASCCVLRVSSTTRTRAFSFNFSISYPDISFYRPPRVTSKFLSREEKEKEKKKKKKKRKRRKAIREIREETMRWLLVKRPRFRTVSNGNNPFLVWRAASRKTFLSISERYGTINNTFVTRGELKTRDKRHTADFILRARHVRSICITTYRVTFTWTRVCVRADASVTVASYVLCRVYSNRRFIRRTEGVGRALFRKRVINVKAYSRIRISGFLLGPLSGG